MNPVDPVRSAPASDAFLRGSAADADDPLAAYSFDLLLGLTRMLDSPRYAFLNYLVGMAAEEAYRLSESGAPLLPPDDRPPRT